MSLDKNDIPRFEGRPVDGVTTTMKQIKTDELDLVASIDDLVQVTSLYKVVYVDHRTDKDGNLIRIQTLELQEQAPQPFDPSDPDDDGVQRIMGRPGIGQVATSVTGQLPSSSAPAAADSNGRSEPGSIDETIAKLDEDAEANA